jgi:hypothetical protein
MLFLLQFQLVLQCFFRLNNQRRCYENVPAPAQHASLDGAELKDCLENNLSGSAEPNGLSLLGAARAPYCLARRQIQAQVSASITGPAAARGCGRSRR